MLKLSKVLSALLSIYGLLDLRCRNHSLAGRLKGHSFERLALFDEAVAAEDPYIRTNPSNSRRYSESNSGAMIGSG